jgi:2-polyprenyl-3-methyl-5-hydroxy-6-metoxy-1,4-benzoquinol methylase
MAASQNGSLCYAKDKIHMTEISENHFDSIAAEYDYWKQKNWYYYQNLISLYRSHIPEGAQVLEIGCGTGDVLAALKPAAGRGIDTSGEMIAIAQKKHAANPRLKFEKEDITQGDAVFPEEYIFLADVLEHVGDMPSFLRHLGQRARPDATVVVSVANPLWEPLLMIAEKLGMKMPEGPHTRYSIRATDRILKEAGFEIHKKQFSLLVPKPVPGSAWLNARFSSVPILRGLGFVVYWVLKTKVHS